MLSPRRIGMPVSLALLAAVGLADGRTAAAGNSADAPAVDTVPGSAAAPTGTIDIVISKLPPFGSSELARLEAAAGPLTAKHLDMTNGDVWRVAADRLPAIEAAAKACGAKVMLPSGTRDGVSGDTSAMMSPLVPMSSGTPMSKAQKSLIKRTKQAGGNSNMGMAGLGDPMMIEYALTKDLGAPGVASGTAPIMLPLGDGTSVMASRTELERTEDGYIWHGAIDGTMEPVTLMWWPSGRLSGQFTHKGRIYAVKPLGEGMHGVMEMKQDDLPPEHAPMPARLMKKMKMKDDPLPMTGDATDLMPAMGETLKSRDDAKKFQDAPDDRAAPAKLGHTIVKPSGASAEAPSEQHEITLLVAYTAAAAAYYSDIEKDLIRLSVADTNRSFVASGIKGVRIKLVHTYKTSYVEKGSHFEHVFRFADKGDGYMEEVHKLRDRKKADISVLIVHDPNGCGLAAGVQPPPERAFAVVHHGCAATTYSLAHEIGHLLGTRHDVGFDDSSSPHPEGHGFVHSTEWRTVMSYKESCGGCPRLPFWSNPNLMIGDTPAGNELANNARVIESQARYIAAYR